jgi:small-conductance mechanosensitive channel
VTAIARGPSPVAGPRRLGVVVVLLVVGCVALASAQQPEPVPTEPAPSTPTVPLSAEPSGQTFTLTYFNRPIVALRARVLGHSPAARAESATRFLDELVADGVTGPVEWREEGAALITVQSRVVFGLFPPDVDELRGETVRQVAERTVRRLQQALDEAAEARTPATLLRATAIAVAALAIGIVLLWGLGRLRRVAAAKLAVIAEHTAARSGLTDLEALRQSRLPDLERWLVTGLIVTLQAIVLYGLLTFDLRLFPYTRPWGESLRGFLFTTVQDLGLGILYSIPGLFTVLLIFLIARFVTRLVGFWFGSIERGLVSVRWLYPETAQPTRRLLTILVWVFAVVIAYPYLPGSGTDAFKGISVFLGLMLTFGSSGLVNQIMSSFMVTYSRALRLDDFVRIGDVEGTVTHIGVLSTKIRTLRGEDVTIPNAVVVAQTTTNYSRLAQSEAGVLASTAVTIGYDAPWRQVHALLLLAAERTSGIRREPTPHVLQMALQDFYVKYELFFSLERQDGRWVVLDELHRHIQDLFNEYGVQIMSPNYLSDPASRKVVPKAHWYAPPATATPGPSGAPPAETV